MNYLAHIHLSGNNDDMIVGGFIADSLKGRHLNSFSDGVQTGILRHRAIDEFTDSHRDFRASKHRLFERQGHYSAVLVDMIYDHFLAVHWELFSDESLRDFTLRVYEMLKERQSEFTPKSSRFYSYMVSRDTLFSSQYLDSFDVVLKHLSTRMKYKNEFKSAIIDLKDNYEDFRTDFLSFYPEIIAHICK